MQKCIYVFSEGGKLGNIVLPFKPTSSEIKTAMFYRVFRSKEIDIHVIGTNENIGIEIARSLAIALYYGQTETVELPKNLYVSRRKR